MIYISRTIEFCASHRLANPGWDDAKNNEVFGRCANPAGHGHNYKLEVTVAGSIDPETGMVMDLKKLKDILYAEIYDHVDHKNLNVDVDFMQNVIPTAENLIVAFWDRMADKLPDNCKLYEMRLWETDANVAVYRGEGASIHVFNK